MEQLHNNRSVTIRVTATPVLTLTGIKLRYNLKDMAYGEWLVYEDNRPKYYINLFDEACEGIRAQVGNNAEAYITDRLRNSVEHLSLKQNIVGLQFGKMREASISVESLPLYLLESV